VRNIDLVDIWDLKSLGSDQIAIFEITPLEGDQTCIFGDYNNVSCLVQLGTNMYQVGVLLQVASHHPNGSIKIPNIGNVYWPRSWPLKARSLM
jgi:hypothetical protein